MVWLLVLGNSVWSVAPTLLLTRTTCDGTSIILLVEWMCDSYSYIRIYYTTDTRNAVCQMTRGSGQYLREGAGQIASQNSIIFYKYNAMKSLFPLIRQSCGPEVKPPKIHIMIWEIKSALPVPIKLLLKFILSPVGGMGDSIPVL